MILRTSVGSILSGGAPIKLASRLFDKDLEATCGQTNVAQQACELSAKTLLESPSERLNEDARDYRSRFEYGMKRFCVRCLRKVYAGFEARQHDDRPAARRIGCSPHVVRTLRVSRVEIMLLAEAGSLRPNLFCDHFCRA